MTPRGRVTSGIGLLHFIDRHFIDRWFINRWFINRWFIDRRRRLCEATPTSRRRQPPAQTGRQCVSGSTYRTSG